MFSSVIPGSVPANSGASASPTSPCAPLIGTVSYRHPSAFAAAVAKSDAPHVSYATVYPLTMLLRIVTAQVLALLLTQG